ncbi:hypothetical protein BST24_21655 [Mycobacteroides franklinii]|nr:hypothetical protein BST24_21655 [Mycobacteroides franklinii]
MAIFPEYWVGSVRMMLAIPYDARRAGVEGGHGDVSFNGVRRGELPPETDIQQLGDYLATALNGLSIQAGDAIPRRRLLALIEPTLSVLPS